MKEIHVKAPLLFMHFLCAINLYASSLSPITQVVCDGGEICNIDSKYEHYVRALADGPVVYIEDHEGHVRSFEMDDKRMLKRTKIYRLPFVSFFYNLCHSNHYELKTKTTSGLMQWAISRTMYDNDPNCITISLFEIVQNYPVLIRNRDPWLYPSDKFLHNGPNIFGVHITAVDQWVAISGYDKKNQRVFAYKKLNYDLAGYNFFMQYQTDYQTTWKTNQLYQFVGKKVGISQTPVSIPINDWVIKPLPEGANPNIFLKKQLDRVILCIPLKSAGKPFCYIGLNNEEIKDVRFQTKYHYCEWPDRRAVRKLMEQSLFDEKSLDIPLKAKLNGSYGLYKVSTCEPVDGVFTDNQTGEETIVYRITSGPIDFFKNKFSYVDKDKNSLDFKLIV